MVWSIRTGPGRLYGCNSGRRLAQKRSRGRSLGILEARGGDCCRSRWAQSWGRGACGADHDSVSRGVDGRHVDIGRNPSGCQRRIGRGQGARADAEVGLGVMRAALRPHGLAPASFCRPCSPRQARTSIFPFLASTCLYAAAILSPTVQR